MSTMTISDYNKIKVKSKVTLETAVKHEIIKYLNAVGVYNFPLLQGMGCHKGLPDRLAIKDGITYYIEIKAAKGKQSPNQIEFQRMIEKSGGIYILAKGIEDLRFLDNRSKLFG